MLRLKCSTKQEAFEIIAGKNSQIKDLAKRFMTQKLIQVEPDLFLAFDDREEWGTWKAKQQADIYAAQKAAQKIVREVLAKAKSEKDEAANKAEGENAQA